MPIHDRAQVDYAQSLVDSAADAVLSAAPRSAAFEVALLRIDLATEALRKARAAYQQRIRRRARKAA